MRHSILKWLEVDYQESWPLFLVGICIIEEEVVCRDDRHMARNKYLFLQMTCCKVHNNPSSLKSEQSSNSHPKWGGRNCHSVYFREYGLSIRNSIIVVWSGGSRRMQWPCFVFALNFVCGHAIHSILVCSNRTERQTVSAQELGANAPQCFPRTGTRYQVPGTVSFT
jgi:hypothetical protein